MKINSALATQMSGSLGGITGSHNKGGMYLRKRVIPTDPGSMEQVAVRGLMAYLSNYWVNNLTASQRTDWDTYAFNVPLTDSLGAAMKVTGLNMFVRTNVQRMQAAIAIQIVAPVVFDLGNFMAVSAVVDESAQTIAVSFTNSDLWAIAVGGFLSLYASRPQNPSVNFFKGPFRYVDTVLGAVVPPTSPATFPVPFVVTAAQRVFWRVITQTVDGRSATPQFGMSTVIA